MNNIIRKRLTTAALPLALLLSTFAFVQSAHAKSDKLIIESGDNAQTRQEAAMDKEQWNDTRELRNKVNKREEKEWDKTDAAFDTRDICRNSTNINAYWESVTRRCLDRRTGKTVLAP